MITSDTLHNLALILGSKSLHDRAIHRFEEECRAEAAFPVPRKEYVAAGTFVPANDWDELWWRQEVDAPDDF